MNYKVGQRYHYSDSSSDGILEIVESTDYSYRWKIKFVQHFGRKCWRLGEIINFNIESGTWEYLEGQDKPYDS